MSGAVTLFNWPFCGQLSIAVVCTTGSSGVATDSRKPIIPAIVATQRVTRTSRSAVAVPPLACSSITRFMGVPESVLAGSSRAP